MKVEKREIRKNMVVTESEERMFHDHLNQVNQDRRRLGLRRYSLSKYAVEAFKEKMERDRNGKQLERTLAA